MTYGPAVRPPLEQRRIGVVAPYDMALDREMWRWTPYDVSLHFTRTPFLDLEVTVEMVESVGDVDVVARCARDLSVTEPEAYLYACTSGSFAGGPAHERSLVAALSRSGAAGITTSGALILALDHLDVTRLAVATPYTTDLTRMLTSFLEASQRSVVGTAHLGRTHDIWKVAYEETAELVRAADHPAAQAVFIACTNLPTYDVIEPLEQELGKPVLSANQVTLWAGLRHLRLPAMAGHQCLFQDFPPAPPPTTTPPTPW